MKPFSLFMRWTLLIGSLVAVLLGVVVFGWRLLPHPATKHPSMAPPPAADASPGQADDMASDSVAVPLNLSASYNAETGDPVGMGTQDGPNSLNEFPTGDRVFAGVKFTVQGMIQLGNIYPNLVKGIKVGGRCQRLHLLHGTAGTADEGATGAVLTLHYADGSAATLPIKYGEHVRDWWNWNSNESTKLDPGTEIAWWGENDFSRARKCRLRVYRSTFANPKPALAIETITYEKRDSRCNPFLLGISME